jgi:hypothetical protein
MANRQLGEVPLDLDGRTYTLVMDINAIAVFEGVFSTPDRDAAFPDLLQKAANGSVRHLRAFFWAALRRHHGAMTIDEVGDLIQRSGGLAGLAEQLKRLSGTMTPDVEDRQGGKGKGKPARP